MPIPSKHTNENKTTFINRCVKFLMNEGTPKEQAIAICYNQIKNESEFEFEPTEFKKDNYLIEGVYEGAFIKSLPNELYQHNYLNIMGGVSWGYGLPIDFDTKSLKFEKATKFKGSIEFFSGVKTKDHVNELNDFVFDENGRKRGFSEFKEKALNINKQYNVNWLKTELNTAYTIAQNAQKWEQIEDEKEIFPLLQYKTAGDARVRPEHKIWDNIIRPVNDKFWDTRYPPNDFMCRCHVIQLRDGEISSLKSVPKNESKYFNNNAGKSGQIFVKTGEKYNKEGLTTPTDEKVRENAIKMKRNAI